jgi:hypothetical protein
MKTTDQISLEKRYSQTKLITEQVQQDGFISDVDLDLDIDYNGEAVDVDAPKQVRVKYGINVEYRGFGIKGIDVHFISASPFSFEIITYDENEDEVRKSIDVDLSSLQHVDTQFNVGRYGEVFPQSINIKLNKDFVPYSGTLVF